jgi:hypothetical protein
MTLWKHAQRLVRLVDWGVADEARSSLTNFAVGIYIVRSLAIGQAAEHVGELVDPVALVAVAGNTSPSAAHSPSAPSGVSGRPQVTVVEPAGRAVPWTITARPRRRRSRRVPGAA